MNQNHLPIQKTASKPRKLGTMQQVVIKHVTNMMGCKDAGLWKAEAKMYSKLAKKYTPEFLLWLIPPEGFKVLSLSYYLTKIGKTYLSGKLVEYSKIQGPSEKIKEYVTINNDKIGEDVQIKHQPKTLKDFLNYGQKNRTNNSDQND